MVLVELGEDGGHLALAEGVVERVVDLLRGDAEAGSGVAIDHQFGLQAAHLLIAGDVAQLRQGLQLADQARRPDGELSNMVFSVCCASYWFSHIAELADWTPRMVAKFKTLPVLTDVASDQQLNGLQAELVIDRDTASRLGITPQNIDDTLYDAFGQRQVSTIFTQLNQYHVVLEVEPKLPAQARMSLDNIYVNSSDGTQVPLCTFTPLRAAQTAARHQPPGPVPRRDHLLQPGPRQLLGDAVNAINKAEASSACPPASTPSFQGTAAAFEASLSNEPLLILAALIIVYIVLGVLYESYIHPITILSTLPSAGVGAILA